MFIPPHLDSYVWIDQITEAAQKARREVQFIGGVVDREALAELRDIVLLQLVSPDVGELVGQNWKVIEVRSTDTVLDQYLAMHPDMGEQWAATHGSAGLATGAWLLERGARLCEVGRPLDLGDGLLIEVQPAAKRTPGRSAALAFYELGPTPAVGGAWQLEAGMLDAHSASAFDAIDLTGRARVILSGPHVFLPPGRWAIKAALELEPEGGRLELITQWGGASLAKTEQRFLTDVPGVYEIQLEADLERSDSTGWLLATDRAHFKGRLRFLSGSIQRLG